MEAKAFILQNKGMCRDLSISKAGESSAFDNHNIRITARDKDTLLSVTNERGNKEATQNTLIYGSLRGYGVLNNYIILFTDYNGGTIYRAEFKNNAFTIIRIFSGKLNLGLDIDTIVDYESEDIQKIYWVDGVNVLRSLNFSDSYLKKYLREGTLTDANPSFSFSNDPTWFDSTKATTSTPNVSITKNNNGVVRSNGSAQYFITYYNKNGQQTGIVYSSPIVYFSPIDRGGASDETNTNEIILSISGLDKTFDCVRVYQIFYSSKDTSPVAYIIGDATIIDNKVVFVDDGSHLESVDVTEFLFLGSKEVVPCTISQKDGTLFLGNLRSIGNSGEDEIYDELKKYAFKLHKSSFEYGVDWESDIVEFVYSTDKELTSEKNHIPYIFADGCYPYNSQLNYTNSQIATFKGGEKYRFAVQFLKSNGVASRAFWVGDKVNTLYPKMRSDNYIARAIAICKLPKEVLDIAEKYNFTSVQLMIARATSADRSIQAQGIINPTVFNVYDRTKGLGFSQASWIYRPRNGNFAYKHFSPVNNSNTAFSELQCNYWEGASPVPYYYSDEKSKLVNEPYGKKTYTHISVNATIYAQKITTKYWGSITIKYYADKTSEAPVESYTFKLGGGTELYHASLLKFIKDWLAAYDEASVPSGNRTTELEIRSLCAQALYKAKWFSEGSVSYNLPNNPSAENDRVVVEFNSRDLSLVFAQLNRQYYYIDESIVTFNSPEIEYETVNVDRNSGLSLRIVGASKMTSNITDYYLECENAQFPGEKTITYDFSNVNTTFKPDGLGAWPLYKEYGYTKVGDKYNRVDYPFAYMTYMFHKSGSVPSFSDDTFGQYSLLSKKCIANLRYAHFTSFNNYDSVNWNIKPDDIRQVNQFGSKLYDVKRGSSTIIYSADIDDLVMMPNDVKYPVFYSTQEVTPGNVLDINSCKKVSDPVPLSYTSKTHAVISFPFKAKETLLPVLFSNDAFSLTEQSDVDNINGPFLPWESDVVTDYELLYRDVDVKNETDVKNLRAGGYSGFVEKSKNKITERITLLADFSTSAELKAELSLMQDTINKVAPNRVCYAHLITSDNTVYITDVNTVKIEKTNIQISLLPNNYRRVKFYCDSVIPIESVKITIYNTGGAELISSFAQVSSNKNTAEVIIEDVNLNAFSEYKVSFIIQYSVFYNVDAIRTILVPQLANTDTIQLSVQMPYYENTYSRYAYVYDSQYIDINSQKTLLNIFSKPYYIFQLTGGIFSVVGQLESTYKLPVQSKYDLSNSLITEDDSYLFIGELYKDYDELAKKDIALDTRYGGISKNAIESNTFIPASSRMTFNSVIDYPSYSSAELDLHNLYDNISQGHISLDTFTLDIGDGKQIELECLKKVSVQSFLPTADNKTDKLCIQKNNENEWCSSLYGYSSTILELIAQDASYKVAIMRVGCARRGKWRKYINKNGVLQSSHTTRNPNYKNMRKGFANGLPPKRLRIIGYDLLICKTGKAGLSNSSTFKNSTERYRNYNDATLISSLGDKLILPVKIENLPVTDSGRYSNASSNGITDLFIGLYHREGIEWKLVSNVVQVRGRKNNNTAVWEFTE